MLEFVALASSKTSDLSVHLYGDEPQGPAVQDLAMAL